MQSHKVRTARPRSAVALLVAIGAIGAFPVAAALAADIEVLHADSLAGPMRELKRAFEAQQPGVNVKLTAGVSRQLAERILKGEVCDVFASSSPAVIDEDLIGRPVAGTGAIAASWYVVFSANEMVIITAKGNPLSIRRASDLARPGLRLARVTGDKDLATGRTIEFLQRATAAPPEAGRFPGVCRGPAARAGSSRSGPRRPPAGPLPAPSPHCG